MTENPVFLNPDDTLEKCSKVMKENHVGAVIIKDKEEPIGILTEQDIVRNVIASGINPLKKKVKEVMEKNLTTITPEKDIFEGLMMMRDLNISHLPVVDGKRLIGLLTIKDILKIEPQLFEILVEKFELKEEERKPIYDKPNADVCQACGKVTDKLYLYKGSRICAECKESTKK